MNLVLSARDKMYDSYHDITEFFIIDIQGAFAAKNNCLMKLTIQ